MMLKLFIVFAVLVALIVVVSGDGGGRRGGGRRGGDRNGGGRRRNRNFNHNRDNDWKRFKARFKRRYIDQDEEDNKREVWEMGQAKIAEHNATGRHRFHIGENCFGDWSHEEYMKLNGYKSPTLYPAIVEGSGPAVEGSGPAKVGSSRRGAFLKGQLPFTLTATSPGTGNVSIDWRNYGAVTDVKDQGSCGCCWAFSAAGSLEGLKKLSTGVLENLSVQNLLGCSTNGNNGCIGGAMVYAFQYVIHNGIDSWDSYPFTGQEGSCLYNASNVAGHCTGFVGIPRRNEEALREAVSAVGPVTAAIDATLESFMMYTGGIYDDENCSSTALSHGVLVVGYGSEKGDDYWLIKNSWGTDWGIDGYMKLARNNNNQCGIATQASYPVML